MTHLAALSLLIGSVFCALGALGVLRFPDMYTRLHASSNAGLLGAGIALLAAALASGDWTIAIRAFLGALFLILTAPVPGHLLARAAVRTLTRLASITSINEHEGNR
jgi:multicomponent Na+:H+ antiporter subunit G